MVTSCRKLKSLTIVNRLKSSENSKVAKVVRHRLRIMRQRSWLKRLCYATWRFWYRLFLRENKIWSEGARTDNKRTILHALFGKVWRLLTTANDIRVSRELKTLWNVEYLNAEKFCFHQFLWWNFPLIFGSLLLRPILMKYFHDAWQIIRITPQINFRSN